MKVVDLSPLIMENLENLVYPGRVYFKVSPILDYNNNLMMSSNVEIWLHAGAHVDAPIHAFREGASIDAAKLDSLVREAVLFDLTKHFDREITGHTLQQAEVALKKTGETVRAGDVIILRTDWSLSRKPWTSQYRENAPYLTKDAADWLVQKKPSAIGFDFPEERVDQLQKSLSGKPRSHPLPIHLELLSAGIYLVEHLTNLNNLKKKRFLFAAAPLNLMGVEGSPIRAFAIEE
jgi:arylformamidase